MAKHRFWMPDCTRGGGPRMIDWDDEAGTVDGDHFAVPTIREHLAWADAKGIVVSHAGWWPMPNARRDAAQFMRVLLFLLQSKGWDPDGVPAALRGVEPTPLIEHDLPDGRVT